MNKRKIAVAIFETMLGLSGLALVWYATNWMAALGIFLMMFGNNIGHSGKHL